MDDETRDVAGVVAPPPLIFAGGLALALLARAVVPAPRLPQRAAVAVGSALVVGGAGLLAWFARSLRRAGTPLEPWEPTSRLVTDGPYRYSHNPDYLAMALVFAGLAALANAFWAVLLLPATLLVIQRGVIDREERYLARLFGEEYARYRGRVGRWL